MQIKVESDWMKCAFFLKGKASIHAEAEKPIVLLLWRPQHIGHDNTDPIQHAVPSPYHPTASWHFETLCFSLLLFPNHYYAHSISIVSAENIRKCIYLLKGRLSEKEGKIEGRRSCLWWFTHRRATIARAGWNLSFQMGCRHCKQWLSSLCHNIPVLIPQKHHLKRLLIASKIHFYHAETKSITSTALSNRSTS